MESLYPLTHEPGRAIALGHVLVLTRPNFNDLCSDVHLLRLCLWLLKQYGILYFDLCNLKTPAGFCDKQYQELNIFSQMSGCLPLQKR
jgi:hypothetical protein